MHNKPNLTHSSQHPIIPAKQKPRQRNPIKTFLAQPNATATANTTPTLPAPAPETHSFNLQQMSLFKMTDVLPGPTSTPPSPHTPRAHYVKLLLIPSPLPRSFSPPPYSSSPPPLLPPFIRLLSFTRSFTSPSLVIARHHAGALPLHKAQKQRDAAQGPERRTPWGRRGRQFESQVGSRGGFVAAQKPPRRSAAIEPARTRHGRVSI